jgi:hypothetical protein
MADAPSKLITPVFRGSFVHLVEPKAPAPGADPKYSIAIVLPKGDPATKAFMKSLNEMVMAKATEKFGKVPKKLKKPWKDGDAEDREEWAGCWVVSASNKTRPGVVGPDLQPVMEPEVLYSGAYYRASITSWGWKHATGGEGNSLNLDNVMWVKDGEPFTNRAKAEDDFADFAGETPAPKKSKVVSTTEEDDGDYDEDFDAF